MSQECMNYNYNYNIMIINNMKQNTLIWLQHEYDWQAAKYKEQNTCTSNIMITNDATQWVQAIWWLSMTWSKIHIFVT